MDQQNIIQKTVEYIKQEFSDDSSGHDWWHIYRVWKNAVTICEYEKADMFIVQLAALLHDLDDWKFNESVDETPLRARAWLESCRVDIPTAETICGIITQISYKGAGVESKMGSLEGFIVQDADCLDAIGAIGIERWTSCWTSWRLPTSTRNTSRRKKESSFRKCGIRWTVGGETTT